jgi:hypothetical protein
VVQLGHAAGTRQGQSGRRRRLAGLFQRRQQLATLLSDCFQIFVLLLE